MLRGSADTRPIKNLREDHHPDALALVPSMKEVPNKECWVPKIILHEDNATCIIAVATGKKAAMETLKRCFGVSLAWLNLRLRSGDYIIIHTRSHDMSADIHTKGLVDKALYKRLKTLANIYILNDIEKTYSILSMRSKRTSSIWSTWTRPRTSTRRQLEASI